MEKNKSIADKIDINKYNSIISHLKLHTVNNKRVVGPELCRMFNLADTELRDIVRFARRNKIPIASDRAGYYFAKNKAEYIPCIEDLKGRITSMSITLHAMETTFNEPQENSLFT